MTNMLRHSEHVSRHYDGRLPARFVLAMDTIMHQTYGDECAVWNHEAWQGRPLLGREVKGTMEYIPETGHTIEYDFGDDFGDEDESP